MGYPLHQTATAYFFRETITTRTNSIVTNTRGVAWFVNDGQKYNWTARATARVARTILICSYYTSPCIVRATLAVALVAPGMKLYLSRVDVTRCESTGTSTLSGEGLVN